MSEIVCLYGIGVMLFFLIKAIIPNLTNVGVFVRL